MVAELGRRARGAGEDADGCGVGWDNADAAAGIDGGAFFRAFLPIAVSEDVAATVRAALTRAFWARIKEVDVIAYVLRRVAELMEMKKAI